MLSIVLHTSSSNTRSCLECRLKGKTLLLSPHKKREDAHILCDAKTQVPIDLTEVKHVPSAAAVVRHLSRRPYESAPRDCRPFIPLSRVVCVCVRVTRTSRVLAAMVACVKEVRKIWIWLFRNVRGEGFEDSSVVLMARGKISAFACFAARKR